MTEQGLYYALPRQDLRALLVEPAGIDGYLQRSAAQAEPLAMLDQGSLWQRDLHLLPEIEAGVAVDGTPALQCWVWPADLVGDSAHRLASMGAASLVQRMQAWQQAQTVAASSPAAIDVLRQWVHRQAALRRFWQAAAERRDALLLYVV